jgi:hypothetical protein
MKDRMIYVFIHIHLHKCTKYQQRLEWVFMVTNSICFRHSLYSCSVYLFSNIEQQIKQYTSKFVLKINGTTIKQERKKQRKERIEIFVLFLLIFLIKLHFSCKYCLTKISFFFRIANINLYIFNRKLR